MKILHISKYYSPYKGGIENVVFNLVEGSIKMGDQVDVLCFNDSLKSSTEEFDNHKIFRAKRLFVLFSLPISFEFFFKLIKLCNHYDIIHVHLPNPLAILAVFLKKVKTKIVIHWHSDIIDQKFIYQFLAPFHKAVLGKANKIIITSNNYLSASTQLFNFHDKCEVIPIGINKKVNFESKSAKSKDVITIFSVGRLVRYKGFEKLITSGKHLDKNIKIIIAGDGPLKLNLEKLIRRHNLENRIILVGRVSDKELFSYYEHADVFCLPSITRNEAFGVVLLEAMSFGLPVVCFNIPGSGVPWVVKDKYNAIVVNKIESLELIKAINKISRDKKLRTDYSLNSKIRFQENFTVEKMQERTNKLYKKLLS